MEEERSIRNNYRRVSLKTVVKCFQEGRKRHMVVNYRNTKQLPASKIVPTEWFQECGEIQQMFKSILSQYQATNTCLLNKAKLNYFIHFTKMICEELCRTQIAWLFPYSEIRYNENLIMYCAKQLTSICFIFANNSSNYVNGESTF